MANSNWRDRILESTRGRVVALLRRSERTVSDLASELGVTDNAVRLHLAALERDGLIEQSGTRSEWTGKPAVLYRTTADAEGLFPKPYDAVLSALLTELEQEHDRSGVERLLRQAGVRLGAAASIPGGDLLTRCRNAAEVLTALGGLAEVVEDGDGYRIQGYSCPLADLVAKHPLTCQLAEELVSELVGGEVSECCERSDRPRCAFHVTAA
ncbi:MAG TPA: ArsR family transcriptional regulator [Longimicrobiales bacterium]|nr:ArsR family transcriptional regulator [Longimicrobiales bacterium]